MFSLGGGEILLIAVVALLLFGPEKIPQFARTIGKFMREFNKYRDILESSVRAEIYRDEWNKEAADGSETKGTDKITQAAEGVKDLVDAQKAKEAAAGSGVADAVFVDLAETAAAAEAAAETASAGEAAKSGKPGPITATSEDEEDEE